MSAFKVVSGSNIPGFTANGSLKVNKYGLNKK
jgi:hypothetical protein